jgi:hypothetical protein
MGAMERWGGNRGEEVLRALGGCEVYRYGKAPTGLKPVFTVRHALVVSYQAIRKC